MNTITKKSVNSGRKHCSNCLKKQIILITCKCEMTLCIVCRYPDKHGCEYDFTTESNKKLTAENPKVISEKIDKI